MRDDHLLNNVSWSTYNFLSSEDRSRCYHISGSNKEPWRRGQETRVVHWARKGCCTQRLGKKGSECTINDEIPRRVCTSLGRSGPSLCSINGSSTHPIPRLSCTWHSVHSWAIVCFVAIHPKILPRNLSIRKKIAELPLVNPDDPRGWWNNHGTLTRAFMSFPFFPSSLVTTTRPALRPPGWPPDWARHRPLLNNNDDDVGKQSRCELLRVPPFANSGLPSIRWWATQAVSMVLVGTPSSGAGTTHATSATESFNDLQRKLQPYIKHQQFPWKTSTHLALLNGNDYGDGKQM